MGPIRGILSEGKLPCHCQLFPSLREGPKVENRIDISPSDHFLLIKFPSRIGNAFRGHCLRNSTFPRNSHRIMVEMVLPLEPNYELSLDAQRSLLFLSLHPNDSEWNCFPVASRMSISPSVERTIGYCFWNITVDFVIIAILCVKEKQTTSGTTIHHFWRLVQFDVWH
jgi:hypothetical protein